MRALIDAHIFIHMLGDADRLTPTQRAFVDSVENDLLLSLAGVWEISIKYNLGKLRLPEPPETLFPAQLDNFGVELLPISLADVLAAGRLLRHHNDPFDRLMIAQAQLHNLPIVSSDQRFPEYGIRVIA